MNKDEAELQTSSTFVADTHTIYWYLRHSDRLPASIQAVFKLVETGNALLVVPAIVVAEFYYLSVKLGLDFSPSDLYERLDGLEGVYFSDLGRTQLERLSVITDIPEMHDRLIAAEAIALDAPLLTRDQALAQSQHVTTIW
jgi:PIN domain nuclease of toxin-antitoxin system